MQRSEALASACQVMWEVRAGLRTDLPVWASERVSQAGPTALLEGILTLWVPETRCAGVELGSCRSGRVCMIGGWRCVWGT
jgi:hypothetical protein